MNSPPTPPQPLDNPAAIRLLMDTFYARVTADELLAPFFQHLDLVEHMPRMYAFWGQMLLGSDAYTGNPMRPHIELHDRMPMQPTHFARWLQLFEHTLHTHFAGQKAEEALSRAHSIAGIMQHKLGLL